MFHHSISAISFITVLTLNLYSGVGESSVITLSFPYGARASAMGEVGTALANDVSALYFNPAGLGMRNESWRKGAVSFSYEPLLPEFDIPDLWHNSFSVYFQLPDNYGGIALSNNFIFMGKNTHFNSFERSHYQESTPFETVLSVGYGCMLNASSLYSHYFGCGLDFIHSALAPGTGSSGEGTATSFAVDIGYIGRFSNGIRFGVNFANMGPALFYNDLNQKDPIPFTFNAAVAYTRNVVGNDFDLLRFSSELRIDKELVINHFDGDPEPFYTALFVDPFNEPASYEFREFNYHAGYEFVLANTFAFRQGLLIDPLGARYELHYGFGLSIYNHLHVDYSYICAPEYYMDNLDHVITGHKHGASGARHKQWQISFYIDALAEWSELDAQWWKVNKKRKKW